MAAAKILVPLEFDGVGRTGLLELWTISDVEKSGFHEDGAFQVRPLMPVPRGQVGFLTTAKLAYRIALNRYGLSAGFCIDWILTPCQGAQFQGFMGGSAGAAFLLAFIRIRLGNFDGRVVRRNTKLEQAIETVRLEWVAASASIDGNGNFGLVDGATLVKKLVALGLERPSSGTRLAVISEAQPPDGLNLCRVEGMPGLFYFRDGLPPSDPLPVIRAVDPTDCYLKLFQLQSQQVLL
jgi:hypothetical protein